MTYGSESECATHYTTAPLMSAYDALQVVDDDVVWGSAGGPDGITTQHLKDLLSLSVPGVANELLKSVTGFVNLMLMAKCPATSMT